MKNIVFKVVNNNIPKDLFTKEGVYTITYKRGNNKPELLYIGEGQIIKRLIAHYEKKTLLINNINAFRDVKNWIITYTIEQDKDTRCFIETALIKLADELSLNPSNYISTAKCRFSDHRHQFQHEKTT